MSAIGVGGRSVLTLGDGDLSFSAALSSLLSSSSVVGLGPRCLVASTFDARECLLRKYGGAAQRAIDLLERRRVPLLHNINAAFLHYDLRASATKDADADDDGDADSDADGDCRMRFEAIVFLHPHCGVESAQRHRQLLAHFLHAAEKVLSPGGRVVVALARGQAERWSIDEQARKSGLVLVDAKVVALEDVFPGFEVRRHQAARSFRCINKHNRRQMQQSALYTLERQAETQSAPLASVDVVWPDVDVELAARSFPCAHCERSFALEMGLRDHVRLRHNSARASVETTTRITCDECDDERRFGSDADLQRHRASKHGLDADIKPDWFRREAKQAALVSATGNANTNGNGAMLQCKVCRFWFADQNELQRHIDELSPSEPVPMACKHCGKRVADQRGLRQHLNFCKAPPHLALSGKPQQSHQPDSIIV